MGNHKQKQNPTLHTMKTFTLAVMLGLASAIKMREDGQQDGNDGSGEEFDVCGALLEITGSGLDWTLADVRGYAEINDPNFDGEGFDACVTEDYVRDLVSWCPEKAGDKPANPCEQGSDGDEEEGGEENDGGHEGGEIDHCAELAAVVDDEGNWNLADLRELAEELDDNFNGEEFDQCVTEDFVGAYITWCGDKANT